MIAKALNVKPLILGACSHITNGLDANGMLFWNGTPIDPEKNPVKAFDSLFGGGTTAPPVNADVQLQQGPARVHRRPRCRGCRRRCRA